MQFNYENHWGITPNVPDFVLDQAKEIRDYKSLSYRVGEVLVARGHASKAEMDAWHESKPENALFGDHLLSLSDVTIGMKEALPRALAAVADNPMLFIGDKEATFVGTSDLMENDDVLATCRDYECFVATIANQSFLAFSNMAAYKKWLQMGPPDRVKSPILRELPEPAYCIADPSLVAEIHNRFAGGTQKGQEFEVWKESELDASGSDSQRYISKMLNHMIKVGASDLLIMPGYHGVRVAARVNGELTNVPSELELPSNLYHQVKNFLVAKSRATKGGPVTKPTDGQAVRYAPNVGAARGLRLSFMPLGNGKSIDRYELRIVARIHSLRGQNDNDNVKRIDDLGIVNPKVVEILRDIVQLKGRLAVMSGPVGSGKTTTMYALIKEMGDYYKGTQAILSLEDPIEQDLDGVDQIELSGQAKDQADAYADYLKILKRQDTNILYLGEIRGSQTAEYAGHFSSMGNTVLTTTHAPTEAQTLALLRSMITRNEDFELLTSCIEYVLAQRLLTKLCKHCKQAHEVTTEERKWVVSTLKSYDYTDDQANKVAAGFSTVYRRGTEDCSFCENTRTSGRLPIIGVLHMSTHLRNLLLDTKIEREVLHQKLQDARTVTMAEQAIEFINLGLAELKGLKYG